MVIDIKDPIFSIDRDETEWRKVVFYREIPRGKIDQSYSNWQKFYAKRWEEMEEQEMRGVGYWRYLNSICPCKKCIKDRGDILRDH
jgi:hypothetical protein